MQINKSQYGQKITEAQSLLIKENTTIRDRLWACEQANNAGHKITYNTLIKVYDRYRNISKNNILALNMLLNIATQIERSKKEMEVAV